MCARMQCREARRWTDDPPAQEFLRDLVRGNLAQKSANAIVPFFSLPSFHALMLAALWKLLRIYCRLRAIPKISFA